MLDIEQGRLKEFIRYHQLSADLKDIDPSYEMLRYVCERFELNMEQRYWLAYLYATCYNASTVFYIYNEFPDYIGVDVGRLDRWWKNNRAALDFQTDCRWVRSRNQFVEMYVRYHSLCGENQEQTYQDLKTYSLCYDYFGNIKYFGRFKLFLLLEAVHVVTELPIVPDHFPLEEAMSSRNGLCFAIGRDDLLCGADYSRAELTKDEYAYLYQSFNDLMELMAVQLPGYRLDIWNVETTLCAYKKFHRGKRWPGYYITRQGKEIASMQSNVKEGVCWDVLWEFRKETYPEKYLWEKTGKDNHEEVGNLGLRQYTLGWDTTGERSGYHLS